MSERTCAISSVRSMGFEEIVAARRERLLKNLVVSRERRGEGTAPGSRTWSRARESSGRSRSHPSPASSRRGGSGPLPRSGLRAARGPRPLPLPTGRRSLRGERRASTRSRFWAWSSTTRMLPVMARCARGSLDGLAEGLRVDRLADVAVEAGREGRRSRGPLIACAVARSRGASRGWGRANVVEHGDPASARDLDVEQDDVERRLPEPRRRTSRMLRASTTRVRDARGAHGRAGGSSTWSSTSSTRLMCLPRPRAESSTPGHGTRPPGVRDRFSLRSMKALPPVGCPRSTIVSMGGCGPRQSAGRASASTTATSQRTASPAATRAAVDLRAGLDEPIGDAIEVVTVANHEHPPMATLLGTIPLNAGRRTASRPRASRDAPRH